MQTVVLGWFGFSAVWFIPLFWRLVKAALPGGGGLAGPGSIRLWLGFVGVLTASCTLATALTGDATTNALGHALARGFEHVFGHVGTPFAMIALFVVGLPWLVGVRWRQVNAWLDASFGIRFARERGDEEPRGVADLPRAALHRDDDRRVRRAADVQPTTAHTVNSMAPRQNGRYARPTLWKPNDAQRGERRSASAGGAARAAAEPTAPAGWLKPGAQPRGAQPAAAMATGAAGTAAAGASTAGFAKVAGAAAAASEPAKTAGGAMSAHHAPKTINPPLSVGGAPKAAGPAMTGSGAAKNAAPGFGHARADNRRREARRGNDAAERSFESGAPRRADGRSSRAARRPRGGRDVTRRVRAGRHRHREADRLDRRGRGARQTRASASGRARSALRAAPPGDAGRRVGGAQSTDDFHAVATDNRRDAPTARAPRADGRADRRDRTQASAGKPGARAALCVAREARGTHRARGERA